MIIVTNCLGNTADEGGMKVCSSLARRIKAANPAVTVVSSGSEAGACDVHCPAGKFLLSWKLVKLLLARKEPVLYLPGYARTLPTAMRIFLLSLFARWGLRVLIVMRAPINRLSAMLLRLSGAEILTLSDESREAFAGVIGRRASQVKTGVDTTRFIPVTPEEKRMLRHKYGLPQDKPIVLHVGHMKEGRNIRQLLKVDERFHVVLVVSTLTAEFEDQELRCALQQKENLTIIDSYIPHIEEIYQAADVYLFPVEKPRHCIDVPLSALEAASCGLPVVSTPYGEMKQLLGRSGFCQLDDFDARNINDVLDTAIRRGEHGREHVLPYDWQHAVTELVQ